MAIGTLSPTEKDLYRIVALVRQLAERLNSGITNAELADMAAGTIKGRRGSTGAAEDLTAGQAYEILGATATVSSSGTTTLDGTHNGKTLFVDATAGNITLALTANGSLPANWLARLVRVDAGANTITVDPDGSETVDGRTTARLISQYDAATIVKQGSNFVTRDARWRRRRIIYTPSGSPHAFTIANEVPLGCPNYFLEAWAGGGSGGGAKINTQRSSGGGGGAHGNKLVPTALDTSLQCTVAQGGAPVAATASGQNGNTGGNTTVVGANLGTLALTGGGGGICAGGIPNNGGSGGGFSGAWDEAIGGEHGAPSAGGTFALGTTFPGGGSPRGGHICVGNVATPGNVPGGGAITSNHTGGSDMSGAGADGRVVITI
jgi:hypothetical protein